MKENKTLRKAEGVGIKQGCAKNKKSRLGLKGT